MKKKIFLAFALAACFGFLLACSSDPEDPAGETTEYYKVSFDLKLPTTGMVGVTTADKPADINVEKGKTATLPAKITKSTSHTHNGWFVDESGGEALTSPYTPTGNITLYAQWTLKEKVTVSFDPTGPDADGEDVTLTSSATISPIQVNKGESATASGATWPTQPTSSTHNFGGWYKATDTNYITAYNATTVINEALSLNAKWTIKPAALTSAPVNVGGTTQNVFVTASTDAEIEYIENGYKVTTSSSYGPFASFKVNLGSGKSIADFKEVTFNYNPVSGDTGYKIIFLVASDDEFSDNLNTSNEYKTSEVAGYDLGAGSASNVTATIGKEKENYIPVLSTAEEINFSFYLHSNAASYEITNITFVPAPTGHQAVTAIAGVAVEIKAEEEFELNGFVFPPYATNKTIVWSLSTGDDGSTEVDAITDGKFTPSEGTITVTATVAGGGATASTPYTQDFEITVFVPGARISVNVGGTTQSNIEVSAKSASTELDVIKISNGYQFTTAGAFNTYSYFQIDLGSKTYADISAVKATVGVTGNDPDYKAFGVTANATEPTSYPGNPATGNEWNHGAASSEITLYKQAAASVTGNTVYLIIWGHLPAGQTVQISNVKVEFTP
jgi:uncharacterized repeat protein (TIGR02543 family)